MFLAAYFTHSSIVRYNITAACMVLWLIVLQFWLQT